MMGLFFVLVLSMVATITLSYKVIKLSTVSVVKSLPSLHATTDVATERYDADSKKKTYSSIGTINSVKNRNFFVSTIMRLTKQYEDWLISLKYYIASVLLKISKSLIGIKGIRYIGREEYVQSRSSNATDTSIDVAEMTYVYCLECENNCWYVGSTHDMISRYAEHTNSKGSKWTSIHQPIRILSCEIVPIQDATSIELKLTAKMMMKHGINYVRGACWCDFKMFAAQDVDRIYRVVAHILGLNYLETKTIMLAMLKNAPIAIEQQISVTAAAPTATASVKKKINKPALSLSAMLPAMKPSKVACRRCGRATHDANDCYAKFHIDGKTEMVPLILNRRLCSKCGKRGHTAESCYSRTHINGGDVFN